MTAPRATVAEQGAPGVPAHARRRRTGWLLLAAILLVQAAWILATPPFRASDEFDHAYRAAGAATGQWHLDQGARDGRGQLVWVPESLVEAASAQCRALSYTGPDNCSAAERDGDRARVATAAGQYDPLFYTVIGQPSRLFDGAHALYAMRVTAAVLCALVLTAGSVVLLSAAGTGRWTLLALVTALSPEVLFSSAVGAPNGLEMACGLALWAALLALGRLRDDPRLERWLLVMAVAAATPLMVIRFLGPLWTLLIVVTAVTYGGWARYADVVRRHRRTTAAGVVVLSLAGAWWAGWAFVASHYDVPADAVPQQAEATGLHYAFMLPTWVLQMVGAFPYRDEPAPLWVYPLVLLVMGALVWTGWRLSSGAARRGITLSLVLLVTVPVALSLVFMSAQGAFWQGRYELPFVVGILPMCGLVLDDRRAGAQEGGRLLLLAGLMLAVTHVASVVNVERQELARPVSAGDPAWVHPALWVTGGIVLLACVVAARLFAPAADPPGAGLGRSQRSST